eukprot:3076641-Rhodomonas_salina.2
MCSTDWYQSVVLTKSVLVLTEGTLVLKCSTDKRCAGTRGGRGGSSAQVPGAPKGGRSRART